jgi:hypothetical protein
MWPNGLFLLVYKVVFIVLSKWGFFNIIAEILLFVDLAAECYGFFPKPTVAGKRRCMTVVVLKVAEFGEFTYEFQLDVI